MAYGFATQDIQLDFWAEEELFNARSFPILIAIGGSLMALLYIAFPPAFEPLDLSGFNSELIGLVVLMLLYAGLLEQLGFLVATGLFLCTGFLVLGERRPARLGLVTIALTGGSGFTSFFLMGEAPVQAFLLPYRLMPQVYVAVLVWFFFIVNFVKIPIVLSMGLVTRDSLWISLLLLPIMPLGIAVGKYIATRIAKDPFYIIVHLLLIVLGSYLIASSAWTLSVGA